MIVGRKKEIEAFQKICNQEAPRFMAIWGRRRVGKTFLVREFFSTKGKFFELVGQKGASTSEQLLNFSQSYGATYLRNAAGSTPPSWQEALAILTRQLTTECKHGKQILFFDEFFKTRPRLIVSRISSCDRRPF